jgi:hypothetical protein
MKKHYEAKTLRGLNRYGSAMDRVDSLLQKIVGEGTNSRLRSWHSGFLSLPGSFLGAHLLLPKIYNNYDVICETDH